MKPTDRLARMRELTEEKYKKETTGDGAQVDKKQKEETQTEGPKKRGPKKKES